MTQIMTNKAGIPLALAVWLAHDEYDYIGHPNYISATALMKPLRQIILPNRTAAEDRVAPDVEDRIAIALGHSIHDSMEKAWTEGYATNLAKLGYSQSVIDRVMINPTDDQLDAADDPIPVYLEQRVFRRFGNYIIGGKYDAITEGIINDTKSTSAYAWMFGGRDEGFQIQGSLYQWLDADGFEHIEMLPEHAFRPRVTEDYMKINFVFTDWQKIMSVSNPAYPARRVMQKDFTLLPNAEIEAWIADKIRLLEKFMNAPENEIPECSQEDLWQSDPVYKYFGNPLKTDGRATKNFDDPVEANQHRAAKGKGVVITKPGEAKRCAYCPAYDNCSQKDRIPHQKPDF